MRFYDNIEDVTIGQVEAHMAALDDDSKVEESVRTLFKDLQEANRPGIQLAVTLLEKYKRQLGRQYDKHHDDTTAILYNQTEDTIQYLCDRFYATRRSKKHYLRVTM